MTETKQEFKNPYLSENMPEGGGLTRDIVVTSAKYVQYILTRKDGTQVIDEKTKQPSVFVGLRIEGISTDPRSEGKTAKYEWSAGKQARPSADGELLVNEKGEPAVIRKTSNLGRAIEGLAAGGFDRALLYPRVGVLVGAKLVLEGVNKVGADGKPKTHEYNGKTYNDLDWFPVEYKGGAGSRVGGNGAGKTAEDLTAKAEAAVVAAIVEAGGSIERKDLIRALGTNLKGDADAIKVTTLVARADFHNGRPWVVEGSTLKLAEA